MHYKSQKQGGGDPPDVLNLIYTIDIFHSLQSTVIPEAQEISSEQ